MVHKTNIAAECECDVCVLGARLCEPAAYMDQLSRVNACVVLCVCCSVCELLSPRSRLAANLASLSRQAASVTRRARPSPRGMRRCVTAPAPRAKDLNHSLRAWLLTCCRLLDLLRSVREDIRGARAHTHAIVLHLNTSSARVKSARSISPLRSWLQHDTLDVLASVDHAAAE
jgi:hypothetical protein